MLVAVFLNKAGGLSNGTEKLGVTCGEDTTGTQQSVRRLQAQKGDVSWGKGDDAGGGDDGGHDDDDEEEEEEELEELEEEEDDDD